MPADSWRFPAQWSRAVTIITVAVMVLVVTVDATLLWVTYTTLANQPSRALALVGALLITGVFVVVSLLAPRNYVVGTDGIVVNRLGPSLVIAYECIQELRRIDSGEIGFAWRIFGSGGFLGWFGWFYSQSLGRFLAYATNQRDLVLITKTDGTKIVISPYPPDAFLEAVKRKREQAARDTRHL